MTIEDNTFLGNDADDNGGAVSIDSTGPGPEEVLTRGDAMPIFLRGNTFGGGEEGDENDGGRGRAAPCTSTSRSGRS